MVVEGDSGTVERFIRDVCETTSGHVSDVKTKRFPAEGQFNGFEIIR